MPAPDGPASAVSRCSGKAGSEVVQVVQLADLDGDLLGRTGPHGTVARHGRGTGQERTHDGVLVRVQLLRRTLRDDRATAGAGSRAEFDHPVGGADEFPFMFDQNDGITVSR